MTPQALLLNVSTLKQGLKQSLSLRHLRSWTLNHNNWQILISIAWFSCKSLFHKKQIYTHSKYENVIQILLLKMLYPTLLITRFPGQQTLVVVLNRSVKSSKGFVYFIFDFLVATFLKLMITWRKVYVACVQTDWREQDNVIDRSCEVKLAHRDTDIWLDQQADNHMTLHLQSARNSHRPTQPML